MLDSGQQEQSDPQQQQEDSLVEEASVELIPPSSSSEDEMPDSLPDMHSVSPQRGSPSSQSRSSQDYGKCATSSNMAFICRLELRAHISFRVYVRVQTLFKMYAGPSQGLQDSALHSIELAQNFLAVSASILC